MARMIARSAAAADILRHVELTHARALARGAPFDDDAERFLGAVLTNATELDEQIDEKRSEVDELRSRQTIEDVACSDLVHRIRDEMFNDIGRTANDRILGLVWIGGGNRYAGVRAWAKPASLEYLAESIERHRHPLIDDAQVEHATARLRDQAARLQAVNAALGPAVTELDMLRKHHTANAKLGQVQLASLKRYWLALNVSEPDIHRLIPVAAPARSRAPAPEELAEAAPLVELEPQDGLETLFEEEPKLAAK